MKKTLRAICSQPECKGLTPVAGKKGLDTEVKWTAVIDTIDLIQFSNEGELNFVTGFGLHNDEEILSITREACNYKMAGIVFAPGGPYIKEVPRSVLDFGDRHDFPVLTIPWESKISNYTKAIGKLIIDEAYSDRTITDILKLILTGKELIPFDSAVTNQLTRQGINKFDSYRVAMIHILAHKDVETKPFKEVYSAILKHINDQYNASAFIIPLKNGMAMIFSGSSAVDIVEKQQVRLMADTLSRLQDKYEGYELRLGFGEMCSKIEKISGSYNEAAVVVNLLSAKTQKEKGIYQYDKLGIYKVIWESKNQKVAMDFSYSILNALEVYDEVNDTDLMNCLRTYIECDCSVKEVSQRLYLHKNTVLYKLKKIESILDCTFSKREDLFNLQYALMIKDVFERKS